MPTIGHLTREKRVAVPIDLGDGDTLNVVFDANKITPAWVQKTQDADVMAVARALADVLFEWDVTDEQGQPYPPTVENLAALSYPVETKIAMRLIEASSPSSEEGNDLSKQPGTPPTASGAPAVTSQNGPATEPSPSVSASPSPT
jgi:hypothetical protein